MKLANVKNNDGHIILTEVKNRYNNVEYIVDIHFKGKEWKSYTYKNIESAMKKYKKATKELCGIYLTKCGQ